MTKNAEQILAIINASHEHLSAEQIFFHLKETNKSVVLATVYNKVLSEKFRWKAFLTAMTIVHGITILYVEIVENCLIFC